MVDRLLVPADAKIPPEAAGGSTYQIHADLLVPRHLIPSGARFEIPRQTRSGAATPPPRFVVAKRLVPVNAQIGVESAASMESGRARWAQEQANVFKDAMLPKASIGHRRSPAEWMISVVVHALILTTLVIVPLFYTQTLDLAGFTATLLVAPPPPAAAPPPPPRAVAAPQPQVRKVFVSRELMMPVAIPKTVLMVRDTAQYEPEPPGLPEGVIGGVPGGEVGGVMGGILGGALTGAVIAPPPAAPAPSGKPLHVGGDVRPPHLLVRIEPKYPVLALQARTQGDVQIDAVIDVNGNVVEMHAISGPPLLIPAALNAVRQWKYEPTYLNGQPYPLELTVHVTFQLS